MQTPSNLLFSNFQPQEFNQLCQEICNVFETSPAELAELYQKIDDNFHTHGYPLQFTKRTFFQSKDEKFHNDYYQNSPAIAVDLPSLMELKNDSVNKPTIAIIAQDPYGKDLCQDVIVGTPFGLHHKDSREKYPPETVFYFEIIYNLLEELNCKVYLTDAYKIWVGDHTKQKIERRQLRIKDRQRFIQLLKRELNIINPVGLIIWGRKAEKAVNKINLEIKHKYLPHPSDANRRVLAKIIDGPVTHENKLKFYKESIKTNITFCDFLKNNFILEDFLIDRIP
jgi:hypothetical protein